MSKQENENPGVSKLLVKYQQRLVDFKARIASNLARLFIYWRIMTGFEILTLVVAIWNLCRSTSFSRFLNKWITKEMVMAEINIFVPSTEGFHKSTVKGASVSLMRPGDGVSYTNEFRDNLRRMLTA